MKRIFLLIENKTNRALLADWLGQHYEVIPFQKDISLSTSFDLCLLDGPTLDRHWQEIRARKALDEPTFLPFVLITLQRETDLITRHLWKTVDELVRGPIEKLDLQARVEMLLRTRLLSLELRMRNEDLKSFFHAMTHDLRAPLRAVSSFSNLLEQENAAQLNERGRQDLGRIRLAARQMQELIDGLVTFARIEYSSRELQPVEIEQVVDVCLAQLDHEITQLGATIKKEGSFPVVQGNKTLLMIAISNLLSNALKFVAPHVTPHVTIQSCLRDGMCHLEITDNGIGIPLQAQSQLFAPFVQLHGIETYGGIGLGLATVRKIVEMLDGRIGVTSQPGQGSVFWLELCPARGEV
ncbi:MAG TPA: ATP-binding protein [Ktedonobacteraceae bacterium]